ncbi:aldose 1-epimerase [Marispirochaeta sp.]|uniref:aldose 1-epimerase n=1 Tax=Marispirochaeta sp. TaxID=2038653 RepID=UPI0029C74924|nr:aldose 1-epimerase [Marispirochaeta sp.]
MTAIEFKTGANRMTVYPELGGTVGALVLAPTGRNTALPILACDREEELLENPWFRGRILFPFCDRIPGAGYRFNGKEYRLPANQEDGSAIHGLIHNRPGEILQQPDSRLKLRWCLGEDLGYPFPVELQLDYQLRDSGLSMDYRIANRGRASAPVGFGWHPYFTLPGTPADELQLTIPCESFVEVEEDLTPTGRLLPVSEAAGRYDFRIPRPLGPGEYDIAFPAETGGAGLTASLASSRYRIDLRISGRFQYFQLFTPPDRRSIALEPISNVTDAFNRSDMGMRILEPAETVAARLEVALSALD